MSAVTKKRLRGALPFLSVFGALLFFGAPVSLLTGLETANPIFTRTEHMIPMRDGVRLYTQVFAPTQANERLPILLLRTPYGTSGLTPEALASMTRELTADGYIIVSQDIRGRFKSEGKFVMLRQPRDPKDRDAIDESTDTYDTIEWLLEHVQNHNGRVGMAGTSYGAWLTVMAMLDPHPALKAIAPQASPADQWIGDDFHHNGAFRLSYGFEYAYLMEASKEQPELSSVFDRYDAYLWYLDLGPLSGIDAKFFHGKIPTWNDFVNHPDYDAFWKRQGFAPWLNRVTVPTLNVAGWWDQEDFYGPLKIYELLERHDTENKNFLVVGPWNHGGWSGEGRKLGWIEFGSATGEYYRKNVLAPFFAYYLKGKGSLVLPEALTFRTGRNEWVRHDAWPPKRNVVEKPLYFQADGKLSFDPPPPSAEGAFDSYVSDPANPVPYRARPIRPMLSSGSGWSTWQLEDQRFVDHRPDVLTWETDPLKEDTVVSGEVVANIFAATTGTDSDWIVKLIDVYSEDFKPDPKMGGYELMVAGDVFRGRYHNSFEKAEPIVPDSVVHYTIKFPGTDHAFLKGHRIMVQVQSTWFPVIDRNPQIFVPNIFVARESDFHKAVQRVFRSGKHTSHILLPILVPEQNSVVMPTGVPRASRG
jgi:putative CocE/NonD family hydrolase